MGETKSLNKVFLLVIFSLVISCSLPDNFQVDQDIFLSHVASKNYIVVDVRTAEEYMRGHFEGCATIDFYEPNFLSKFKFISSEVSLVLYCNDGTRSAEALKILKEEYGFTKISILFGGIEHWPDLSTFLITN